MANDSMKSSTEYVMLEAEKVFLYQVSEMSVDYPGLGPTLKLRTLFQQHTTNMLLQITGWCAAGRVPSRVTTETVEYPDGPWQALWDRYAPKWTKEKWPTRMAKVEVKCQTHHYFMCPHLPLPNNDRDTHIRFMMTAQGARGRF